jgi:NhaA family Na+:H+ antiporter
MSLRPKSPFQEFFQTEAAGGALLVATAAIALLVANSGWAAAYERALDAHVGITLGGRGLTLSVHQWINDGLMAVFFLLVGLEIKRELLAGELASARRAALPIAGAIGGMILPALIYLVVVGGGMAARGWAIPMATDIAFALGALALAAPRAPGSLKVFLASLAIVDDMGAVIVIALYYASQIDWVPLAMAGLGVSLLALFNVLRVQRLTPYLLVGSALWYFVHASGVHATIAGVLLALAIPMRTHIDPDEAAERELLIGMERGRTAVSAPLVRLEHSLQRFSAFVVMPLFAVANAGVTVDGWSEWRVTLAVFLGLVVGKTLGITGAALMAIRWQVASVTEGFSALALHGCAWLGGIGFTMSLFIATLAFEDAILVDAAKVGILTGSLVSGIIGAALVRRGIRSSA